MFGKWIDRFGSTFKEVNAPCHPPTPHPLGYILSHCLLCHHLQSVFFIAFLASLVTGHSVSTKVCSSDKLMVFPVIFK